MIGKADVSNREEALEKVARIDGVFVKFGRVFMEARDADIRLDTVLSPRMVEFETTILEAVQQVRVNFNGVAAVAREPGPNSLDDPATLARRVEDACLPLSELATGSSGFTRVWAVHVLGEVGVQNSIETLKAVRKFSR